MMEDHAKTEEEAKEEIKLEPDDVLEKELKGYKALKTQRWSSSGIPEDPKAPAYLLSKDWHKKWKRFLGAERKYIYQSYNNESDKENPKGKARPGPISQDDILEKNEDFYRSDDEKDIYNVVLKAEMRERVDFKIINDKQWEYLYNIYGGCPIQREKYKEEYYSINIAIITKMEK